MARPGVNDGNDLSGESGIPSGLNRIKILHAPYGLNNSARHDSVKFSDSGGGCLPPAAEKKKKKVKEGRTKTSHDKEGFHRGRKIAHWFTSYLMKDNRAAKNIHPNTEVNDLGAKMLDKDDYWGTKNSTEKDLSERSQTRKVPSGFKSFSHELGPKGGIRTAPPRAHSYNDLKEILGSFSSRFDAAKVVVNTELSQFARDVQEFLEKEHPSPEGQKAAEDLLILAQVCTEMSSAELRAKCGGIVHNLADNRQQCQAGLVKQLFTRMLFILTRCTRLLQFEKDHEPIDENSLHKFKQCLESIPAVEMSWLQPLTADFSAQNKCGMKHLLSGKDVSFSLSERTGCWFEELSGNSAKVLRNDFITLVPELLSQNPQIDAQPNKVRLTEFDSHPYSASQTSAFSSYQKDNIKQCHQVPDGFPGHFLHKRSCDSLHEQEKSFDDSDSVICRICENTVPTSHLESHSYVCAYADNCDLKYLDIDERLSKLAEILEQITESCTMNNRASHASPEISRLQNGNSAVVCEGQSPKIVEWHSKGVEGMFEDLHEMDTAFIDESLVGTFSNLKGHGGMKSNPYGPPSSTGSMTSISSTNTPRASHFDLFWLEHNNAYESEDVQEMMNLAELARYIAGADLTKEGASELLLTYMHGLQDILQHSKLKALVIDTFGSRVENLLREKYLLACEQMDSRSPDGARKYKGGCLVDNDSQSSVISTPSYSTHKDRTSIEDFEIIKPISRGAYGEVFLARKRTTGDIFAIKVLKKLDMIRKNDIDRILAERNILITVRNPFVVRFFYSFTCRDNLYLVMEYLNGGDLYSLLRAVGCLEEDVARAYIAELVLALEYLHSLGIVHRDLKPDNILIGHDGHIKLTDFGLSKIGLINSTVDLSGSEAKDATLAVVDDIHTSFEHTQQMDERSAVGTPDYLAPEILLGTEHGYAADWWSVGIILFEFITGIPPFNAECPEMIFDNILNKEIPWPIVPTEMSYEAQDLINRLLIHDPDQRLGANGASEVKAHPFFKGVNWDTLTSQKAAFVPNPESADDTSYFVSRHSQISNGTMEDQNASDSESSTTDCCSNSELEMDEFGDLADFNSSPLDLSLLNFSFKNLSQLAAINYDVLLQRDSSNSSSPSRGTSH